MTRRPVHMVEPSEPDYEVRDTGDVIKAMLNGHIELDNLRFDNISKSIDDIKKKMDLAIYGIVGAVGVAVLNLVLKH